MASNPTPARADDAASPPSRVAVVDVSLTAGLFASPELLNRVLDVTPMHRLPEPEDIASAIIYLASEQARLITGHTLPVDGGFGDSSSGAQARRNSSRIVLRTTPSSVSA